MVAVAMVSDAQCLCSSDRTEAGAPYRVKACQSLGPWLARVSVALLLQVQVFLEDSW